MVKDMNKKEMRLEIKSLTEDIEILESVIKSLHNELDNVFNLSEVLLNRLKTCEEAQHNIRAIVEGA